jgi:GGDEF domain-containing protein
MISLKKYLKADRIEELAAVRARVNHLLLEAIRLHAVEADAADLERFRAEVADLDRRLEAAATPADALVVAGEAIKALEAYNHRVGRLIRAQVLELRQMVAVLTEGLERLSMGGERAIANLKQINRQVERVSTIEDIRLLKVRLAECVRELEQEAVRQREESSRLITHLKTEVTRLAEGSRREPRFDPVTGLLGRPEAVRAIEAASAGGRHSYAAVFVVDRLALVNNRFGYAAGDQMLRDFAARLRSFLSDADSLFRWSGPAFVALVERQAPEAVLEREVRRFAAQRQEEFLEGGGRSGLISVTVSWTILPLFRFGSAEPVIRKIDQFVSLQSEPAAARSE